VDDRTVDPGWPRGAQLAWMLVPLTGYGMRRWLARDGLVSLRQLFLKFASIWFWIGILVLLFQPAGGSLTTGWIAVVVVLGIAVAVAVVLIRTRALDCSSATALGGRYKSRVLTATAVAQASVVGGFVCTFMADTERVYFLVVPFAVVALAIAAPSVRDMRRSQARLDAGGCTLSLVAALRGP
jgi:hypothetical protein